MCLPTSWLDCVYNAVLTLYRHATIPLTNDTIIASCAYRDSWAKPPTGAPDRQILPVPEKGAFARHASEEPPSALESTLSQIWSELLLRDCVSRHDNFFELGGHSLLV